MMVLGANWIIKKKFIFTKIFVDYLLCIFFYFRQKYKELHDIRGHSLAFSSQKSPSSAMMVLGTLKKMGFNSSFFSNLQETGTVEVTS